MAYELKNLLPAAEWSTGNRCRISQYHSLVSLQIYDSYLCKGKSKTDFGVIVEAYTQLQR